MIVCSNCGFENEDGTEFCARCHAYLDWERERVPEPKQGLDSKPRDGDIQIPESRTPQSPIQPKAVPPKNDPNMARQPEDEKPVVPKPKESFKAKSNIRPTDVVCPRCKEGNDPKRTFCRRCGFELSGPAASSSDGQRRPLNKAGDRPVHRFRWLRRLVKTMAALAAVLLLFGLVSPLRGPATRGAESVVDRVRGAFNAKGARPTPAPSRDRSPASQLPVLVRPASITATSTAPPATDLAGTRVTYEPARAIDEDPATAWRTIGDGTGERLEIIFEGRNRLSRIGLVPGYSKVDPKDGIDRFVENRRITEVIYRFDDGNTANQRFTDSPTTQMIDVNVVTSSVVIEILKTSGPARRDYTAISEVEIYGSAP